MAVDLKVSAAASAPPLKGTRATRAVKAAPAAEDVTAERAVAIDALSAIPTVACLATGQLADAGTIQMYWPKMSQEIAKLASTVPQIATIADRIRIIGPYAGILSVAVPMALQFAVNHKLVKAGAGGTQSPDSIAAQIQTEMARAEVESLKAQMAAERESRELKAEFEKLQASNAA